MITNANSRTPQAEDFIPSTPRGKVPIHERAAHAYSATLSVKILDSYEAILANTGLWNWPGTRDSDLDYFLFFARSRAEVIRPHVLVASRGETPEAMLIGKLEHRRIPLQFGHVTFSSPCLRVLTFVYGGLRGSTSQDTTEALVDEALKTLRHGDAELVVFEPVTVGTRLFDALRSLPSALERGFYWAHQNHYRMQLPPDSKQLAKVLSPRQRRNQGRIRRKLVADFSGNVAWVWHTHATPELYRDVEFVAARSHQRRSRVGFEDTPELRAWWDFAASKGWLRICILYAGGKPCAFCTGIAHAKIWWGDYMAYDRHLAAYSPGMQLLLGCLGELCDKRETHGIEEINLGPGDSYLKTTLSRSCKQESSIYLYPPTLQGAALNSLFSLLLLADATARKCVARASPLRSLARNLRRIDLK